MSQYPCEVHGTTMPGSLDAFYMRILDARDVWFRKVRLCHEHALEFLEVHEKEWKYLHPMYGIDFAGICTRCDKVFVNAGAMSRLYVDVYTRGHEPIKYTGEYCHECSIIIIDSLDLVLEDNRHDAARLAAIRRGLAYRQAYDGSEQSKGSSVIDRSGGS